MLPCGLLGFILIMKTLFNKNRSLFLHLVPPPKIEIHGQKKYVVAFFRFFNVYVIFFLKFCRCLKKYVYRELAKKKQKFYKNSRVFNALNALNTEMFIRWVYDLSSLQTERQSIYRNLEDRCTKLGCKYPLILVLQSYPFRFFYKRKKY
jgi:hypothetical protein